MRVHYGEPGSVTAPCGYVFVKRLRGLDRCPTWDPKAPVPVSCLDCLVLHRPAKRKILPWQTVKKYR